MRRQLSSRHTWAYRWLIPALLTIAAIYAVWVSALRPAAGVPTTLSVLTGIAIAAALMIVARILDRAKRVWLRDDSLVISDYRQEIEVRLTDIREITLTRYFWPDRIRIRFRQPTAFGDSIVFFPPHHMPPFSGKHPLIEELERLRGH